MQIPKICFVVWLVSRSTCAIIREKPGVVKHFFKLFCKILKRDGLSIMFLEISVGRFCVIGEIDGDFFNGTVENFAKRVERIGADILIFAQTTQLSSTEVIILEQLILGNTAFLHSLPKWVVTNHINVPSSVVDNYSIKNWPHIDN